MTGSSEKYPVVLKGKPAALGPKRSVVMGYSLTVAAPGVRPLALDWYETRYHAREEAERVLESKGFRMARDWRCTRPAQYSFDGDGGDWTVSVLTFTGCVSRAAAALADRKLAGRDLTAMVFAGADLTGADLRRADLTRADLSGANLTRAKLAGACLHAARLRGANLTGADLRGTDLTGARFEDAVLTGADLSHTVSDGSTLLTGARMERAVLVGARVKWASQADLSAADLTSADLRHFGLHDTSLRGATLTGANIYRMELSGVDLTGATLPDLDTVVHVTWDERTSWDPAHEAAIRGRSCEVKPYSSATALRPRTSRGLSRCSGGVASSGYPCASGC